MESKILITETSKDYELLDSGEGEKLERFGDFVLARPDPQALWRKRLPASAWAKADGVFARDDKKGEWRLKSGVPERWSMELAGIRFWVRPTVFKHTGIFPEQSKNWEWLRGVLSDGAAPRIVSDVGSEPSSEAGCTRPPPTSYSPPRKDGEGGCFSVPPSPIVGEEPTSLTIRGAADAGQTEVLNLFGYTGGATLACAQAGAKVVHVDGSKVAIGWARENVELSDLKDRPIRWILDDAQAFVKREIKRGRKYQGIIMDPPAFGHGPEGELWKIEDDLLPLVESCFSLIGDADEDGHDNVHNNAAPNSNPKFFLINGYAAGYSALAYENLLKNLQNKFGGTIEIGELAIKESETDGKDARILPCGIFARWAK